MSKPDTSAEELRKKFERYHRGCDKYEVLRGIYPNDRRLTEKPCSCGLDKLITTYTKQRELALLERVDEEVIGKNQKRFKQQFPSAFTSSVSVESHDKEVSQRNNLKKSQRTALAAIKSEIGGE